MADTENETTEYYCAAQTYAATLETPAEYCENEVEDEGDYCSEHGGGDYEDEEPPDFDDWRHGTGSYDRDFYDD